MNKELEALEKIKKVKVDKETPMSATYLIHDKRYTEDVAVIEKGLEALKIIRNKRVNVLTLLQCCYDIGKYNAKCSKLQSMLTLDEVNLLKEVLQ